MPFSFFFIVLIGCASVNDGFAKPDELDPVREALFRFAFENNGSAHQQDVKYYFLEIDGKDPSKEFLQRFSDLDQSIEPRSSAKNHCRPRFSGKAVSHRHKTGYGLIFQISNIEKIDEKKYSVSWGYLEGCLSASLNNAIVEKIGNKWVVSADELIIISEKGPNNTQHGDVASLRPCALR